MAKIISKEKVLQVHPDAKCSTVGGSERYYIKNVTNNGKVLGFYPTEAQAWKYAWLAINAEQKRLAGKENKERVNIRLTPSITTAIIKQYGTLQKWADATTKDFLTNK